MITVKIPRNNVYEICDSESEVIQKAEDFRFKDPLPEIVPSLLNKHDIIRYVSKTAMIFPFNIDQLKSASYEANVGRNAVSWDGNNKKEYIYRDNKKIILKKNSITYISIDTKFFLPFYIAVRFNLTITHVHRGILLGTGPLVDPGFNGDLMIPLHNLTNNDYEVSPGDPLIAIEFTKLTPDDLLKYPEDVSDWYRKNIKNPDFDFVRYFKHALPLGIGKVESSLSETLSDARKEIESFKRIKSLLSVASFLGAFAIVGVIVGAISIVSDANKFVADTSILIDDKRENIYNLEDFAKRSELANIRSDINKINDNFKYYPYLRFVEKKIIVDQRLLELEKRVQELESKAKEANLNATN